MDESDHLRSKSSLGFLLLKMDRYEDGYALLKEAADEGDHLGRAAVTQVERGMNLLVQPVPGSIDAMLFETEAMILRIHILRAFRDSVNTMLPDRTDGCKNRAVSL